MSVADPQMARRGGGTVKGTLAILLSVLVALGSYDRQAALRDRPINEHGICKLHYARFHALWTLPLLAVLYTLALPFLTQLDYGKLALLPIIAFVWTTPWDNALVRNGAWWYPRTCVSARIGYVPIEEYAFFILQSLITTLLTTLLTRWFTPRSATSSQLSIALPALPIVALTVGLTALYGKHGNGSHYYIAMIAWWSSIPLALLWYGTRRSWSVVGRSREGIAWLSCLALPTIYLCSGDVFALRRGTWHISERKSLQRYVVPDLPVEEALFFFVTNMILISACFTFDRVVWQRRTRQVAQSASHATPMSPTFFRLAWKSVPIVWSTFMSLDQPSLPNASADGPYAAQQAQDHALDILQTASKSFHAASTLLPWDLRVDLGCLYAFARAMDDFIDAPQKQVTRGGKGRGIPMLRDLVEAAFSTDESAPTAHVAQRIEVTLTLHSAAFKQDSSQRRDLLLSAQAASVLRGIVPVHLWHELIDGYATDNDGQRGPHFSTFEQQAAYAQDVAGSIGEMCVRVVLARAGYVVDRAYRTPRDLRQALLATATSAAAGLPIPVVRYDRALPTKDAARLTPKMIAVVLRDARRMGVALQLVNIARDVFKDADELRRCYLVLDDDEDADAKQLRDILSGRRSKTSLVDALDRKVIFDHRIGLVDLAESIFGACIATIDSLPARPARTGLRTACAVYMAIGDAIRRDGPAKCLQRSHLSPARRMLVALRAVYSG